jgi:hypothetical protein
MHTDTHKCLPALTDSTDHTQMSACTNRQYRHTQQISIKEQYFNDIYVNCLNLKEREKERERKDNMDKNKQKE